jgi:hypothetical protein
MINIDMLVGLIGRLLHASPGKEVYDKYIDDSGTPEY